MKPDVRFLLSLEVQANGCNSCCSHSCIWYSRYRNTRFSHTRNSHTRSHMLLPVHPLFTLNQLIPSSPLSPLNIVSKKSSSIPSMSRFSGTGDPPHSLAPAHGVKRKRPLSCLPGDSINPLSHRPGVLKQFRVAGYPHTEQIPSHLIPEFPHRPWKNAESTTTPDCFKSTSHTESTEATLPPPATSSRSGRNGRDKLISSLQECVQVCLERGDIHRARKAINGLASAESQTTQGRNGQFPWDLQAECLMNVTGGGNRTLQDQRGQKNDSRGWDPENTLPELRAYLSSLIAKQTRSAINPTSAAPLLNIWWALLSAELYGASMEYSNIEHLDYHDSRDLSGAEDSASSAVSESRKHLSPHPAFPISGENRCSSGSVRMDQARNAALGVVETAVRHLGRLVHSKPYKTDQNILHLYATALLFFADLKIPTMDGFQPDYTEARLEREDLRRQAKAVVASVGRLGGQVDHRLQRLLGIALGR